VNEFDYNTHRSRFGRRVSTHTAPTPSGAVCFLPRRGEGDNRMHYNNARVTARKWDGLSDSFCPEFRGHLS